MSLIVIGRRVVPQFTVQEPRPRLWRKVLSTVNRWLWGAFCCGVPGVPCYFCNCSERVEIETPPTGFVVEEMAIEPSELEARPHRPHAPGGRKSSPELISAVRCALSELQGNYTRSQTDIKPDIKKICTSEPG